MTTSKPDSYGAEQRPEFEIGEHDIGDIVQCQRIHSVYQPIVSLRDGGILGYEALTRGPAGSPLHSPDRLFSSAARAGLLYPLDRLAREKAIRGAFFAEGRELLFLNISAAVLNDPQFVPGRTLELLEAKGMDPGRIVFELTERSSIEDFSAAKRILEHYRNQGYRIAIDDAGAGYSSLQAIAELQPDFIKVDRSLVQGVQHHKTKEAILETFVSFARKLGIEMIAEGIEQQEELLYLTRMGVHYGQGYLLGAPGSEQAVVSDRLVRHIVQHRKIHDTAGSAWTIGDLCSPAAAFDRQTQISEVADYFKNHLNAQGVVIVSDGIPVGLMMRERLFQQLAGQYGFSLFWHRTIDQFMDAHPLIVDEHMPVETVSTLATSRAINNLYDLVVITREGRMAGAASIRAILECITNARMENAKVASPLTGLPGNIQIYRELNKRLSDNKRFAVIYADLDYFKWFNDRYGFQKGDQLIQFAADIIQQSVVVCGHPFDFVGHIGGDDFIVITSAEQPEKLCKELIRRFDQGACLFVEGDKGIFVEDRSGNRVEAKSVTVSLSLILCEREAAVTPEQISQVAAKLKKQSKSVIGSAFRSERIGLGGEDVQNNSSS
ncbi:GGDEF domain-containing protein [Paenibacillus doosanensis]|nr:MULTISPECIES: GGDEF domain-containing protein [Paenibacillus]MCS7463039.1 GGDEF domain-containing protein [Paenibacillus doosanensis]